MTLTPGLYWATVRGVPDVIVMVDLNGYGHHDTLCGDCRHTAAEQITDAHPLIVLDPSKFNVVWVCQILRGTPDGVSYVVDQIEAQTRPPRIEEPDRGKHVMAQLGAASKSEEFLRFAVANNSEYHWVSLRTGSVYIWNALTNPTLVRAGVES